MAPGDLQEVLAVLRPSGTPAPTELLVGLGAADDAAVYRLAPDLALVETVDFFPPVVDDPWTWGAVAAVNAMSFVYAMGGEVMFALAVAGFPREMDKRIIAEVFRGGRDKVAEAGGVIAGGHTVVDAEPKYGLRRGDRVFLSKPLGTGVITTAAKNGVAGAERLASAVSSMLRLNRVAAAVARESGARGATDITGFGFLGHAGEMVKASNAGLEIDAARLPVLPGTRELAEAGQFSGGMKRNRRYVDSAFGPALTIAPSVPGYLASLLTEAETSGGLLFSVAPDRAGSVIDGFKGRGEECWEIGRVLPEPLLRVNP